MHINRYAHLNVRHYVWDASLELIRKLNLGCIFSKKKLLLLSNIFLHSQVQTGDPTGTGRLCESVYGEPFPTEKHGRLKFRNRGMVGVANGGKNTNTNGSQFFITLGRQDDLNGVNTIFARVGGDTL